MDDRIATMSKPHIAIACILHPPGDIRIFSRLSVELAKRNWHVSLIAPDVPPIPVMPTGVDFYPQEPRQGYFNRLRAAYRMNTLLRKLRPDIVLFPDPESMPALLHYRNRNGAPVVFDRHENFELGREQAKQSFSNKALAGIYPRYERYATGKLDGVIVVHANMIPALHPKANVIVAENYPSRVVFDRLQGKAPADTKRYTCVHLGTIEEARGPIYMLHVARELVKVRGRQDFSILIGGVFSPGQHYQMTSYIAQHGLSEHAELRLGKADHQEYADLLRASRIGLCQYLENKVTTIGLANKVVEYMAAGLPVITSPQTKNEEVVRESGCGVWHWADEVSATADSIEDMLDNPERSRIMGNAGREYVRENLLWGQELDRLEPWLLEIITNCKRGRVG